MHFNRIVTHSDELEVFYFAVASDIESLEYSCRFSVRDFYTKGAKAITYLYANRFVSGGIEGLKTSSS